MRFDTPIYFQRVQPGKLDENTHNYGEDTIFEDKVFASVSTTTTETLKIVYGDIKQNSLTIKLQMPYKNPFDRIKVGDKFYKPDSVKQLRNKQVFVVSEVPGSYTGNSASGATYEDGYKDGFTDGETQGYNNGYTKGEADGKQAEYDAFWDDVQANGTRTDYSYFFQGNAWNDVTFKPKYDIKPTFARNMFYFNTHSEISIDLVELLQNCGVVMDFSNCTSFNGTFNSNYAIRRIGVLDIRKNTNCANAFAYALAETIDSLVVDENTNLVNLFASAGSIKNITINGTIGQSIELPSAAITVASAKSIINALKDYSQTDKAYTYNVTFSGATKTALNKEGATAPNGLTWLEYAQAKGWNA